ncbi:putative uncharacterized protein [Clostridium sp. CAG:590]|nr:putative uncharacterized protein [Clostridium sp. CAG:590]
MKNMKKSMKCLIALMVMAMAFCVTGVNAQAAKKTQKVTFFVGEKIQHTFIGYGKIKSAKSSNKKVISVKKNNRGVVSTVKKKGKATLTIKGTRNTLVYKATVTTPKLEASLPTRTSGENSRSIVTLNNKGVGYYSSVDVKYIFYDANGTMLGYKNAYFYRVGAKKKAYAEVYLGSSYDNADLSKTTYEISYRRDVDANFKDYSKKVKYSLKESGSNIVINAKSSYKGKGYVYAGYTIFFYDAAGNVIDCEDFYLSLDKKNKTNARTIYKPNKAVSYKLVNTRAYEVKY